jgi:hypothetical protein
MDKPARAVSPDPHTPWDGRRLPPTIRVSDEDPVGVGNFPTLPLYFLIHGRIGGNFIREKNRIGRLGIQIMKNYAMPVPFQFRNSGLGDGMVEALSRWMS